MIERIGISLEEELLRRFDRLIEQKGYVNRSEAVRDLIRDALVQREWSESEGGEERVAVVAAAPRSATGTKPRAASSGPPSAS